VTYEVALTPAAARQLRRLDRQAQRRLQAVIDLLADDPRPPAAKQLVGGVGQWRVRTGDFRVVYEIQDARLLVLVVAVGHRREIYRQR
jgi:mRNA interferase RelE/StbE